MGIFYVYVQWYLCYFDFAACRYVPHPEDVGSLFVRNVGVSPQSPDDVA